MRVDNFPLKLTGRTSSPQRTVAISNGSFQTTTTRRIETGTSGTAMAESEPVAFLYGTVQYWFERWVCGGNFWVFWCAGPVFVQPVFCELFWGSPSVFVGPALEALDAGRFDRRKHIDYHFGPITFVLSRSVQKFCHALKTWHSMECLPIAL